MPKDTHSCFEVSEVVCRIHHKLQVFLPSLVELPLTTHSLSPACLRPISRGELPCLNPLYCRHQRSPNTHTVSLLSDPENLPTAWDHLPGSDSSRCGRSTSTHSW